MSSERHVGLGVARVTSTWFTEVARWSTSGLLAMDFVKAMSLEEVQARLESGRAFSVLLVDGALPGIDRDLVARAHERGCAVIVVSADRGRDWSAVGADAVLAPDFDRTVLGAALSEHATPVSAADELPGQPPVVPTIGGFRAPTIAVTGPGGTGRSILAAALAQGVAADVAHSDAIVLADLALHADQAMLHDVGDVIPGILELVDSHRAATPSPAEIRRMTFDIATRRYRLLLGLRRHRDWTAIRSRALRAGLDGLRRTFTLVVADVDSDLEGEAETGSADVEDRNVLARTTVSLADVVVIVGTCGIKGTHSVLRVVRDCLAAGVDADRIVLVLNRCPKRGSVRADTGRAITELLQASHPGAPLLSPVFVPERAQLEAVLESGAPIPAAIVDPITAAVRTRLRALDERAAPPSEEPVAVVPGSIGSWSDWEGETA